MILLGTVGLDERLLSPGAWLREWKLFTSVPAAIVEGPPATRTRQYREKKPGFLIVNYEQVLKDVPELVRLSPDLVVLDEAQRIKNWAANTSLHVKQLQPAWRLVLTGTPLENRLTELASLMDWVDDLALEPNRRRQEGPVRRRLRRLVRRGAVREGRSLHGDAAEGPRACRPP